MKRTAAPPTRVDWEQLHRRLRAAEKRMQEGVTDAEQAEILRQRAADLSRKQAEEGQGEELIVLEFTLANERYGLESLEVREVFPLHEFTALPGAPAFLLGIVNLRGRILPVLDLKRFFQLPEHGLTDMNKVLVLEGQGIEIGLLADTVAGLNRVMETALQPALPTLTGVRQELLRGIAPGRLIVLDAQKILSASKLRFQAETSP